jgi:hypothetical protein
MHTIPALRTRIPISALQCLDVGQPIPSFPWEVWRMLLSIRKAVTTCIQRRLAAQLQLKQAFPYGSPRAFFYLPQRKLQVVRSQFHQFQLRLRQPLVELRVMLVLLLLESSVLVHFF